jgi:hypothetical protein
MSDNGLDDSDTIEMTFSLKLTSQSSHVSACRGAGQRTGAADAEKGAQT